MRTIHRAVLAAAVAFLLLAVAMSGDRESRAAAAKWGPQVSPDAEWLRKEYGQPAPAAKEEAKASTAKAAAAKS